MGDDGGENRVALVVDEAEQHVRRGRQENLYRGFADVVKRVENRTDEGALPTDFSDADAEQAAVVRLGGDDDEQLLGGVREEVSERGRGVPHRVVRPNRRQARPDEVEGEDEQREQKRVSERRAVDVPAEVSAVGERERSGNEDEQEGVVDRAVGEVAGGKRPEAPRGPDDAPDDEGAVEPREAGEPAA